MKKDNKNTISATDLANDLLHLRNLQFRRDDPMMYLPVENRAAARAEIEEIKPIILRKIAKAGGLNKVDKTLRQAGNNCESTRIQGLDLDELLQ